LQHKVPDSVCARDHFADHHEDYSDGKTRT
jgi:hypothetical protein